MQRLGQMIQQLARSKSHWDKLMKASESATAAFEQYTSPSRLTEVAGFGSNPGNLRMLAYVPEILGPSPALVVVLHGCKQNAAGYDHGSGWSALADRYGFVLLYPEQQEANNPNRCFNWFQEGDIGRDHGEAHSIRQMVEHAVRAYGIDRDRIFVNGLSAGGAMTSVMLAAYPEVFAGGAVIAGLPYHCATSVAEAFECMFQGKTYQAQEWGDLVRGASPHRGPWPKLSVWHGTADETVKSMNAGEIVKQWTDVHGLPSRPSRSDMVDGYPRRVWTNAAGEDVIEEYAITGMRHGTPLSVGKDENSYGAAGPFLLDVGISSSYRIAKFWGLAEQAVHTERQETSMTRQETANRSLEETFLPSTAFPERPSDDEPASSDGFNPMGRKPHGGIDIGAVITKALKSAGLMK